MAQLTQRVAARIPSDPVEFWLERLDQRTRPANRSHLERWMRWLRKQPGWEQVTPRELLVRHLDSEDSFIVLDLVQHYVNQLVLRKSSKRKSYSVVKSFFTHNRCALPPDPSFRIRGDKPPVQVKLTAVDIAEVGSGNSSAHERRCQLAAQEALGAAAPMSLTLEEKDEPTR